MIRNFCLIAAITMCCCAKAQVTGNSFQLKPDERQSIVIKLVAQIIEKENYKTLPLNDSLSALIFDRYLKSLDQGHILFLERDLKTLSPFKTAFDDDLKAGNLDHAFQVFNLSQTRFQDRLSYSIGLLNNTFDFSKKETAVFDRSKLPFVKDNTEMDVLWNKKVKYDLLVLSRTYKDISKSKELLKKRYQDLLFQSQQLSSQDAFQRFMDAVTNSVDPHAAYFNPFNASEFEVSMSRSLDGIGATLALEDGYVTVKAITAGGPAAKTKMFETDDRIMAIAEGQAGNFQDVVGWRIDRVISLIRGKKGTLVRLKLLSKTKNDTDEPKVVAVTRDKVILEDQSAKKEVKEYVKDGRKVRIGIINIPQFYADYKAFSRGDANYKSTTRDVKLLLDSLKDLKVDGVVIDLRQNGGGSLNESISLTGLFIKTGPVVQVRDTKGDIEVSKDQQPLVAYDGPLAILVDRLSASASEIFAAAIQDYGRGIIIGTQTYGKGTVQSDLNLDQIVASSQYKDQATALAAKDHAATNSNQNLFGQFNMTVGKFYRINGSSTQHLGVKPDVSLPTLLPFDVYGEDNEKSALPWDTVGKTVYTRAGDFSNALPELQKLHHSRFQQSGLDQYVSLTVAAYRKNTVGKAFSLSALVNKQEIDEREKQQLIRKNILRKAMQLSPIKSGAKPAKNEDLDFVKKESGEMLSDYILLLKVGNN